MTTDITVTGMTCAHCVTAVTKELSALPGVTKVDVDLASGAVSIQSDDVLEDAAIAAAVDEAGYAVA